MGWYGLSVGAAPVIAPTLAGMLVDTLGWRMIFYVSIGIMFAAFLFAIAVFDDVLETVDRKFDLISFAISIFTFGGITLGIGNIGAYSLTGIQTYLPLITGFIASAVFVYRQLHLDTPFLNLRILKSRDYTLSVIGSMLLYPVSYTHLDVYKRQG